jgi:hypothetical protein
VLYDLSQVKDRRATYVVSKACTISLMMPLCGEFVSNTAS